ncbi:MAG: dehalogenase [Dehalococcoides mccartyi]|uniref:Zinc ribbon domain-containing protein n=1 Tax=Dehalococcoides mccartyi TaxID=61435 RepID=A0A2J1E093_9CHLR|nr:ABC-2 transporter permease [Dehalococcoides mccartyi]OBW62569.1 MAG: dehalogenase [Dehalococcoides mccartyi]PKH47861.1 zinc ribbon domain-containing protein [Dehalococcoides mccartyi]
MWYIIGLLSGVAILALVFWLRNRKANLTWYEWLIGVAGFGLLLFTIQNFEGSMAELSQNAAWVFLLVTGLPSLILLAISWQLSSRRLKKA